VSEVKSHTHFPIPRVGDTVEINRKWAIGEEAIYTVIDVMHRYWEDKNELIDTYEVVVTLEKVDCTFVEYRQRLKNKE
jgi:hypothetical protein